MKTQKIVGFEQGPTSSGMMTWYCAVLACGHNWYDPTRSWEPIKGISANIGDEKECERCKYIADSVERLTNLDVVAERINYFRFKPNFGGQYHAYKLDSTSPTGVLLHSSYPACPEIDAVIDSRRLCTLSPTEGRTR